MTETKMKPATALPWEVIRGADQRSGTMVCGGKPYSGAAHAPAIVRRAGIGTHADATYIAHACNSYPQLVAALRELMLRCDGEEGVRADGSNIQTMKASALLESLGELE